MREGKIRKGLDLLREILKTEDKNLKVIYNLGCCYFLLGQYTFALKWFEQCLKILKIETSSFDLA